MHAGDIYHAITIGDYHKVQELINSVTNVNDTDFNKTPLHVASLHDHIDIAQLLIQRGADFNQPDDIGETPLHLAAKCGHEDIAELIIQGGADVNRSEDDGETPLHMASQEGHKDIAELLIQGGADVNRSEHKGKTPLHLAAKYGHKDIARLLIQNGADVNRSQHNGDTPLHLAAKYSHEDMARFLIQNGADVNRSQHNGDTVLRRAQDLFINQHTERTIAWLVAHGASIDQIDYNDLQDIKQELRMLINGRIPNQNTAILPTQEQYAVLAGHGHHAVVDYLNMKSNIQTIQHVVTTAARRGHFDIVRDILNKNLLPHNEKIQVFKDLAHAAQNGTYKDAHNISRFNDTAQINPTIEQRHDMSQTVRTWLEKVNQQEAMHQQQKQQTAFTDIDIITQS